MNNTNLFKCKPRQLKKFLKECIEAGLVPFVQSSPGVGKSSIVRSVAEDFDLKLIDHRLSTSEPTDMTGLPSFTKDGFARFSPFEELFPLEGTALPKKNGKDQQGWLLFFDEANAASKSVQAASYKLVLDKMVGQHRLHSHVAMVMAGNLVTDHAIVNPLSTAMQSRLVHLELQVDFEEWLKDVAIPQNYDSRIIAFLSQFPSKLMDFRPDHSEKTFCCPRTWEFVNRLITTNQNGMVIPKELNPDSPILLTGAITSGVALEFVQFTKVYSQMININDILRDPHTCPLPQDLNLKWAVTMHITEKVDDKNFDAVANYADRMSLEFRILFYRTLVIRNKTIRNHPDFGKHMAKISQYLTS